MLCGAPRTNSPREYKTWFYYLESYSKYIFNLFIYIPLCEIISKDAWDGRAKPSGDTGDYKKKKKKRLGEAVSDSPDQD